MLGNKPLKSVIWIASYPKSGNTWMQSVIREAGKTFGVPGRDLDVYKLIEEKRSPEIAGGIRPDVSRSATTVLKTHSHYMHGRVPHPQLGLKPMGFVYVMRNPLDLLLSYINFTRLQYGKNKHEKWYQESLFIDLLGFEKIIPYEEWAGMSLDTIPRDNLDHALMRFMQLETAIPGLSMVGSSWLEHCISWFNVGKTLPSVFSRYEDLLKGHEYFLTLQKIFTFSDIQIIEAVNTVNQRQRALQFNKIFYNKMSSYYYVQYFSSGLIARFLNRFEQELKLLGYGDLPEHA